MDNESKLRPAAAMTRDEFVAKAKTLLEELAVDHEEHTGVTATETHTWDYWQEELTSAYLNS